jgi:3'(2'), 5'-bisphosphate nucleotidase
MLHSDLANGPGARLLDELTSIVSRAAAAILAARAQALDPRTKADHSPVTRADDAAEALILDALARLLPGVPVISEEAVERAPPTSLAGDFVLVDPVDGTRELVAGRDEFTVNVALVRGGRPVVGLIAHIGECGLCLS